MFGIRVTNEVVATCPFPSHAQDPMSGRSEESGAEVYINPVAVHVRRDSTWASCSATLLHVLLQSRIQESVRRRIDLGLEGQGNVEMLSSRGSFPLITSHSTPEEMASLFPVSASINVDPDSAYRMALP
jgi:hypothetical protein